MAELKLGMSEVIDIVKNNISLPPQVESIVVNNQNIDISINPGPFIPIIKISLAFNKFQDGKLFLLLKNKRLLFELVGKFFYKKEVLKENVSLDDLPNIVIPVNKIIAKNVKGIQIQQMSIINEQVIIKSKV